MSRYLVIMPIGIGDALAIGSRAVERILYHDPTALEQIDLLCSPIQVELFLYDPRIAKITTIDPQLFSTPEPSTWLRSLWLSPQTRQLQRQLQQQHYTAIYPGMTTPLFYMRLHAPVMQISLVQLLKNVTAIRSGQTISIGTMTQQIIDAHFRQLSYSTPQKASLYEQVAPPYLYLRAYHLQNALVTLEHVKTCLHMPTNGKLLVISPDTSSEITRPPTHLLAAAIATALQQASHLYVCILPSYTDKEASNRLYCELSLYKGRIWFIPPNTLHPLHSLLLAAVFIEQADIFITGDTGMMHLAVSTKIVVDQPLKVPKLKRTAIIALFGGTNPGVHGYPQHSTILGNGRREQRMIRPGIVKEGYNTKGRDMFDHISPQELTHAILAAL